MYIDENRFIPKKTLGDNSKKIVPLSAVTRLSVGRFKWIFLI
jgi:hypothetical protein